MASPRRTIRRRDHRDLLRWPSMASKPARGVLVPNAEPLLIGAQIADGKAVRHFVGEIEEVAIWSRALTDHELAAPSTMTHRQPHRRGETLEWQGQDLKLFSPEFKCDHPARAPARPVLLGRDPATAGPRHSLQKPLRAHSRCSGPNPPSRALPRPFLCLHSLAPSSHHRMRSVSVSSNPDALSKRP